MPRGERQEEAAETRDRILRRSIKSWRVQSFLRVDPGKGRAVALLIPLPAANFSPFLLSFFLFFIFYFIFFSFPDPLQARRLLVLLSSPLAVSMSPYVALCAVPSAFLIRVLA